MWIVVEAVWVSFEWGIDLSQGDLNGYSRFKTQLSRHNACGWNSSGTDALFALEAGITYSAYLMWYYSSGYNQEYHTNPLYMWIHGEFIGEGAF